MRNLARSSTHYPGFAENTSFAPGANGALEIDFGKYADVPGSAGSFTGTLSGFTTGDRIDLVGLQYGAHTTLTFSPSPDPKNPGGVLKVSDGTNVTMIHLAGSYVPSGFHVADDGTGSAVITYGASPSSPELPLPFGLNSTNHHGVPGAVVTQSYGERDHGGPGSNSFDQLLYYSVDFSLDKGTAVLTEASGTIVYVSDTVHDTENEAPTYAEVNGVLTPISSQASHVGPHGLGNYVTIQYDNGVYATYAHLEFIEPGKLPVQVGQHVTLGQTMGFVGDTGAFTGTHLHVTYGVGDVNLGTTRQPDLIANGSFADNHGRPPVLFPAFHDTSPTAGQSVIGDVQTASAVTAIGLPSDSAFQHGLL